MWAKRYSLRLDPKSWLINLQPNTTIPTTCWLHMHIYTCTNSYIMYILGLPPLHLFHYWKRSMHCKTNYMYWHLKLVNNKTQKTQQQPSAQYTHGIPCIFVYRYTVTRRPMGLVALLVMLNLTCHMTSSFCLMSVLLMWSILLFD